ncbi:MAG: hypothetical protein ACHP65_07400 [Legionellales bacterium]
MKSSSCFFATAAAAGATIVSGALSSALMTASGAVGASILDIKYSDYDLSEAVKMGAVGGAILGAAEGVLGFCQNMLSNPSNQEEQNSKSDCMKGITAYTIHAVASGLIGYGILYANDDQATMGASQTAAAFAVGGAVTAIPTTISLLCCCLPLLACRAVQSAQEATTAKEVTTAQVVIEIPTAPRI